MSLSSKTKRWLSAHCLPSLAGKTVLITGSNSGVGFKMAETMVYLGAAVIMACRNLQKASEARAVLLEQYPDAHIDIMHLDLASFASIDDFAHRIRTQGLDIDAFVNNAGAFHHPGQRTADGLDLVMGTNYIGTYRLTEQVLSYLSRLRHDVFLLNTISISYQYATIDYQDFYCVKHPSSMRVYARSKLCLARYSHALAQQYRDTRVHVLMIHPGMTATPLGTNAVGMTSKSPAIRVSRRFFNTPEKSSLALAYVLSNDVPDGSLVGPAKGLGGWGYPQVNYLASTAAVGCEELIQFTETELRRMGSWPNTSQPGVN